MKKRSAILLILLLCVSTALAECPHFSVEDYPIPDGSTATLPLSYLLFERSTGVDGQTAENSISHSKTTASFTELVEGRADILLVYEPADEAWEYAEEQGVELESKAIGLDAPVFLINTGNPLDSLTQDQVVGIYTGEYTNWKDVGGADLPIVAYQRNKTSGSQVMVEALVMQGAEMMEAPERLAPGLMDGLVSDIASYSNTANAIGYSVYYYVDNMYFEEGIKLLAIDGVAPTNESIADGSYPWRQPFYAVIRASEPADSPARQLYDWLTTEEGFALIEEAGYVAARS